MFGADEQVRHGGRSKRLRGVRAQGCGREKNNPQNHWNGRLFFLDRPVGGTFRHISSVNSPWHNVAGEVMRAELRSKTVAFVAILALMTFGALATASAQPADIKAIDKALQDHYARGNYPAAEIDAQKL